MATTIDLTVDSGNSVAQLNAFTNALDGLNDRIAGFKVTAATFNSAGELIGGTVTSQIGKFGELTQQIKNVGGALTVLSSKYTDNASAAKKASEQATLFESVLNRIGRNAIQFASYRLFAFVTDQITEGIKAAKEFEIQLSLIRTISQDQQLSPAGFGQQVRGVSDITGIDLNKVAKAFYDTTSNQIAKGLNVAPFVKDAANLARVTGSELPDAVNLLSSAINAYGYSSRDAEKLSAIFFRTIDEGRVVASELANTFGRVAVLGSNLGVSIEDLNAVLAITTQKGFKTSDAMTLLTNLLIKLEKPTEATKAFFQSIGVDTGEAAVKLLGFNGVLREMVNAVKSGRVDVSAFFDEIRGRKQFGVFEQSIDQIENFSNKLKDTGETLRTYANAVEIRGESPADKLVKEFNKLGNVFKVDIGEKILKAAADFAEWSGGADRLKNNLQEVGVVIGFVTLSLVGYTIQSRIATASNIQLAGTFTAVGTAATRALAVVGTAVGAYSGFVLGKKLFGEGEDNAFGKIDIGKLTATADIIEKINKDMKEMEARKKPGEPGLFGDIDKQNKVISSTFQDVLGLLARANVANNKFLDEAKQKSKDVAESIKTGFGTFTDTIKNNISELKKGITDANTEIERSRKFTLSLNDSIDALILKSQLSFASDEQKINLIENKISANIAKIKELYASGDIKQVAEGRNLAKDTLSLISDVSDQRQQLARKNFEEYLKQNPSELAAYGNVFTATTEEQQKRLASFAATLQDLEKSERRRLATTIEANKQLVAGEEERLRKIQASFKAFEELNVFEKSGSLKGEYKDKLTGQLDPTKLNAALNKYEDDIRNSFQGTFAERVQLEFLLAQKRDAINKEVAAQERADYIKTAQQRSISEQEAYDKRQKQIRDDRQAAIDSQKQIGEYLKTVPTQAQGFANVLGRDSSLSQLDKSKIVEQGNALQTSIDNINKRIASGQSIDIEQTDILLRQYQRFLETVKQLRDASRTEGALTLTDKEGRQITPGGSEEALKQQLEELIKASRLLKASPVREAVESQLFDQTVKGPLDAIKAQFPELANSANDATKNIDKSFKDLANGGLEDLRRKLEEVQKLLQQTGLPLGLGGKVGAANIGGEEAFAATGGIVGLFPGQPRGADVFPIWAARGETIISASTSAMYRPMLDAIMSRRMPRYMADGGVVGDTSIGDINVTVNGAHTNSDTGRAIASKLEREFRRRNISFNPKN